MVTQRVPFGELFAFSELSLASELTENAESVPPGVFSFSAFLRAVFCIRRSVRDVSVSVPSLSKPKGTLPFPSGCAKFQPKLSDSLVGTGAGVNTRVPFRVAKGTIGIETRVR